jgi:CitMHS family citrate-Mg2+:H+ or citrate-Ca2+:H+ symporter
MLTVLGFAMVTTFMVLIMAKKLSPHLALILVPILFGLLAGFTTELSPMMMEGIRNLAPIAVMLMFAILFFGVMIDTGLFEPIVGFIIKLVGSDPLKITLATAALAIFVSLDGDGSTAYMITGAALLPLYRRVGINPLIFTCIMMMASGLMNLTPWGGPTARAATVLKVSPNDLFLPIIPVMAICALWIFFAAYIFGKKERTRLGTRQNLDFEHSREEAFEESEKPQSAHHHKMLPVNILITVTLLVFLIMGLLPLPVIFMVGFAIALIVNYPDPKEQRERLMAHAGNSLAVSSMIFSAGIFTGILSGTGMVDAMAASVVDFIPVSLSPYLPLIIAVLSLPFTFFISNDAFYFGILPILMSAAQKYGFAPGEVGIASLVGQQIHLLSPLVPSTYLLVSLAKVELGDHQRFTLPWAFGAAIVMIVAAMVFGVLPLSH